MNIFEKMLAISTEMNNVNKNLAVNIGKSSYKAVGEADVLKAVKKLEEKYKVYSYPSARRIVKDDILTSKKEYNGQITESSQVLMRLEVEYTFVNAEKPEEQITVTTYGDGVDSQDKAPGKAMTYADKYALMKAYKIVTGDDPDQEGSKEMFVTGEKKLDKIKLATLGEVAKGLQTETVLKVLADYGYKTSKDIKVKDFKAICDSLKELKK